MEESLEINPITLTFRSHVVEDDFNRTTFETVRRQSRLGFLLALLLYLAFAFLDPWIVPEARMEILQIRIAVAVLILLLIGLSFTPLFRRVTQITLAMLPLIGGLGIVRMVALSEQAGGLLYYAGLNLAIIWAFLFVDLQFLYALAVSLFLIMAYNGVALSIRPTPLHIILSNNFFLLGTFAMSAFAGYTIKRQFRVNYCQSRLIEYERQRSENLLLNILPVEIIDQLKGGNHIIASSFEAVTVMFADIADFTPLSAQITPIELVDLLNEIFSYFDGLATKYDLEKIKTVGDAYMVAGGVPRQHANHAPAVAHMALEICKYVCHHPALENRGINFRIGIHSGPVVAGVIGHSKFQYDMWGDVVNTASRMQTHGEAGKIQITKATYDFLKDDFVCERRGMIDVRGKGPMETWFLLASKNHANTSVAVSSAVGQEGRETLELNEG